MRQCAPDGLFDGLTLWTVLLRILPLVSDESALHGLVVRAELPAGTVIGATMRAFAGMPRMRLTDFDAVAEGLVALAAKSVAPALVRAGHSVIPQPLAPSRSPLLDIDRKLASPDLSANSIAAKSAIWASLYAGAVRTGRRHRRNTSARCG